MLLMTFVALLAAGHPQDVYDAPLLRPDIAAVFEDVARQPLVIGEMPRADLYHRLAVAYSSGDGVERDVVTACGYAQLAQLAHGSARHKHAGDGPRLIADW